MNLTIFIIMILETDRLIIRKLTKEDASFFYDLVNDESWKRFIGDRNVNTIQDAEDYLTNKIMASYQKFGFGFYVVIEKETNNSLGISGFIKRKELEHVVDGFAFLPVGRGKCYAFESANALMKYGKTTLNFTTVLAIVNKDNKRSHRLLEKLGLRFEKYVQLYDEEQEISLFTT